MKGFLGLAIASVLCLSGSSASATNYYVDTNGSDANPGTSSSPFASIQAAVNVAAPGDVVIVNDGTYAPPAGAGCSGGSGYAVNINMAGTSSAPITIRAANKRGATLDAQNACIAYFNLGASAAYITIQDFKIINGYWGGIWINSGATSFITIKGNEIAYMGRRVETASQGILGVYANQGAHDLVFDGNTLHDIGRTGGLPTQPANDHGLYLHSYNSTIINNTCYQPVQGWCIQAAVGFSGLIANNTFFGAQTDIYGQGRIDDGQIMLWDSEGAVTVENNIFYGPNTSGVAVYTFSTTGPCSIDHNLVYGNGLTMVDQDVSSQCTVSNNLFNMDPMLVNVSSAPYDFHLMSGSPAIDSGVAISVVDHDFDGNPRPQGGGYDIGAFEYGSGTSGPAVSLSPSSVTFGSQLVGTTSATQYVTVTNTGNATLNFTLDTVSGDFALAGSGTCGPSLAPGNSCTISLNFTPAQAGTRTGTLTINDNAPDTPQIVNISGTGYTSTAPAVNLSPSSVTFSSQLVGTTSGTQYVTVTNTGNATLNFTANFALTGDFAFAQTGNCGTQLAAGSSCNISLNFTPTQSGTRTGTLTLYDDAPDSPQVVSLSGTGYSNQAPAVSLSTTSLNFGRVRVGRTSSAQYVTVTNTGNATLNFTVDTVTGDFALAGSGTCGPSLAPGNSCTISIDFKPTAKGTRTGTLSINDDAPDSPQIVNLTGSGG